MSKAIRLRTLKICHTIHFLLLFWGYWHGFYEIIHDSLIFHLLNNFILIKFSQVGVIGQGNFYCIKELMILQMLFKLTLHVFCSIEEKKFNFKFELKWSHFL